MKKNILLVLLSAALLTGCEFDITLQRLFGGKDNEPEQQQKEDENKENSPENPGENQNTDGDGGQSTPSGGDQTPTDPKDIDELENQYTATILTSGSKFASDFSGGSHFDTETKQTNLKNFLSSQLEYEGLISSIACTNLHAQTFDDVTYLSFGSQKNVGALALTSAIKIYKVEVKVLCYAKYNDTDHVTNIDSNAHFMINSDDHDMSYDGLTNPSVMSFEKSFEEGANTFNLASNSGRVFLQSMTITWKK